MNKIGVGPIIALFIILTIIFKGDPAEQFHKLWIYLLIIFVGSFLISISNKKFMDSIGGGRNLHLSVNSRMLLICIGAILMLFALSEIIWGYIPKDTLIYLVITVPCYVVGVGMIYLASRAEINR